MRASQSNGVGLGSDSPGSTARAKAAKTDPWRSSKEELGGRESRYRVGNFRRNQVTRKQAGTLAVCYSDGQRFS